MKPTNRALRTISGGIIIVFAWVTLVQGQTAVPPQPDSDETQPASSDIVRFSGTHTTKVAPSTAPGRVFDARQARFINDGVKWGLITLEGKPDAPGQQWIGGFASTSKPWDASWDDHKDLDGPTRNSAVISFTTTRTKISDLHYFNVHDAVRTNGNHWLVEHNWGEYVRDDAIENDHLFSGRVFDCLFDGCYSGISARPRKSNQETTGSGSVIELDQVLLRLEAMPYPYKWKTKKDVFDEQDRPFKGSGIPYCHGHIFKLTDDNRCPHFVIKNCVFLLSHRTDRDKLDFPPEHLIDECHKNVIIWLGTGDYPGTLPNSKFPGSVKVVTGAAGTKLWREKVIDWHKRHPQVGADRKPVEPGLLKFPIKF